MLLLLSSSLYPKKNGEKQGWAKEALERGIQSMKSEKSSEALAHFDNAIKLDRYCHDAFTAKGAALANKGKVMQAIKCFQVRARVAGWC